MRQTQMQADYKILSKKKYVVNEDIRQKVQKIFIRTLSDEKMNQIFKKKLDSAMIFFKNFIKLKKTST